MAASDTTPVLNLISDFPYVIKPFPLVTLRSYGALVLPAAPKKNVEEALE
jgi:hypothetical protein